MVTVFFGGIRIEGSETRIVQRRQFLQTRVELQKGEVFDDPGKFVVVEAVDLPYDALFDRHFVTSLRP